MNYSERDSAKKDTADANGLRFGIVVSQFNSSITNKLLEGALMTLKEANVLSEDIQVVRVPGALEIPVALKTLIESKKYDAFICLGAVIRGETSHYDVVVRESSHGVMDLSREYGIPLGFGILTENQEQALARSGGNVGNAGSQATMAAIEMAHLLKRLRERSLCPEETIVQAGLKGHNDLSINGIK